MEFNKKISYCIYETSIPKIGEVSFASVRTYENFDEACKIYLKLKESKQDNKDISFVKKTTNFEVLSDLEEC